MPARSPISSRTAMPALTSAKASRHSCQSARQSSPAADSGVLDRLALGEQGERGIDAAGPEGHAGRGQAELDAAERADQHQLVEVAEVPDAERAALQPSETGAERHVEPIEHDRAEPVRIVPRQGCPA